MFCLDSYESFHAHTTKEGAASLYKITYVPRSHSLLNVTLVSLGLGVSSRIFATWMSWRQEDDDEGQGPSFTLAFTPIDEYAKHDQERVEQVQDMIRRDAGAAAAIPATVRG